MTSTCVVWLNKLLLPAAAHAALCLQGKKQAGRLDILASYHEAARVCLDLLGLWTEEPAGVLQELRQLALKR